MPGPLLIVAIVVGAAVLVLLGIVALSVDNWSRDLTTNFAETSEDADDEALRPIETRFSVATVGQLVIDAAASLPGWSEPHVDPEVGLATYRFVRTTGLLGFKDDITVRVKATAEGTRITAESQSRVGRGDLGQNPRNLKELLTAIRERLQAAER
jgi:uncharacterized protein (DUF1499 family)